MVVFDRLPNNDIHMTIKGLTVAEYYKRGATVTSTEKDMLYVTTAQHEHEFEFQTGTEAFKTLRLRPKPQGRPPSGL